MTVTAAYSDEFYQSVVDAQLSGMTQKKIAVEYGVTAAAVARWMRVARDRGLAVSKGRGRAVWSRQCPCCGAPESMWKQEPKQKEVK